MRIQSKTLALTSRGTRNATIYWSKRSNHRSSSAKLFADAEKEESEYESRSKPSQADIIQQKQENWDGEERIQDTVLRMLIDKYKPLRTGQIRTADEKLKEHIPQILAKTNTQPSTENDSNSGHFHGTPYMESSRPSPNPTPAPTSDRLSPAEPTPPWLVTFKVPSHAQASIKLGNFVSTPPRLVTGSDLLQKSVSSDPSSARTRAKQKAERRFALGAGRIDRARESIIDYQSGVHGQETRSRPNPVSIRGWNALIEERIQKAQATGMFDKIEGRGKPLKQTVEEMNPFVAREEFLMNRIVRKNDAAPPWVELQKEVEGAILQLRELLITNWTRRVTRMLPLSNPRSVLEGLTPESVSKIRDDEWEQQEAKFHEAVVRDTNEVIRRYNAVAPYIARRPLLTRESELSKCYTRAADGIVANIQERLAEGKHADTLEKEAPVGPGQPSHPIGWELGRLLSDAMKRAYTRLFGRMY